MVIYKCSFKFQTRSCVSVATHLQLAEASHLNAWIVSLSPDLCLQQSFATEFEGTGPGKEILWFVGG